MSNNVFGILIKTLRKKARLSIEKTASLLELTSEDIDNFENGDLPSLAQIKQLALVYHTDYKKLIKVLSPEQLKQAKNPLLNLKEEKKVDIDTEMLGMVLTSFRLEKGYNYEEVALKTSISINKLKMIENGEICLSLSEINNLANFYEIGLNQLLDEKEIEQLTRGELGEPLVTDEKLNPKAFARITKIEDLTETIQNRIIDLNVTYYALAKKISELRGDNSPAGRYHSAITRAITSENGSSRFATVMEILSVLGGQFLIEWQDKLDND